MLGDLHTEIATMALIGDWLEGSEWSDLFVAAGISTPGTSDAFLKGHNVKRCRYAHQVSVAALYHLFKKQWEEQTSSLATTLSNWIIERRAKCSQFNYWYTVIELEALLLLFVRSIREANFKRYHQCLEQIVPWMFNMDHTYYARWLSVFLQTLYDLEAFYPDVFAEFMNGRFVIQKSKKKFSCIGVDHAHEQNNKVVKGEGV